jgi:Gas vesicle protein G
VGLLTGLLTLPLAPVRGTVWIAERLIEEAELELGDETAVRRRLAELEVRHELGEISDEELAEAEDALLAQLAARREAKGGSDGA